MISGSDFKNKIAAAMQTFSTQEAKTEGGGKNLVVDGAGVSKISTEADETVILLAEGDDLVVADSDWNKIEAQAGNNTIQVKGDNNSVLAENGNNDIDVVGGKNTVRTNNGDNNVHVTGNINFIYTDNGDNTVTLIGDASEIHTNNGNNDILSIGAYNIIDMKNGDNKMSSAGSYNKIYADEGNNIINSFGNKNEITTNHGNNRIQSGGDENIITTDNGNNEIYISGYEHDKEDPNELLLTGNGYNNVVNAGNGNDVIIAYGDGNTLNGGNGNDIIKSEGDKNKINGGNGHDGILSIGNKNNIQGGNGNDSLLSLGNNNNIGGGDGNNKIVFDGNNLNITAGNGNNYISTLDFAIMDKTDSTYDLYVDYLNDQIKTKTENNVLMDSVTETKEVSRTVETKVSQANSDIMNQLADIDKTYLDKIDLNALAKDGNPKYLIAKGKSDGKYHIYEYSSSGTYKAVAGFTNGKRDYSKVSSGNGYLYLNKNTTKEEQEVIYTTTTKTTITTQEVTTNTYADVERTVIEGNKNINITTGNGDNYMHLNVSKNLNIKTGDGNNTIDQTGEIVVDEVAKNERTEEVLGEEKTHTEETTSKEKETITTASGNYSTGSPLIVDFDKDGKVEAIAGKGVDVDNNGYADGAATGGDKMLAMSDINGNGSIDGGEVFGDHTISPFTGEKLNAANGFEALKMIAEQAAEHTGINCIENGNVNLAELQKALKTVGINLGFVSDGNITELEDLGHVASINVEDYTEQDESGEVQHRQLGSYTDTEGETYKTDDVWFKLFGKK